MKIIFAGTPDAAVPTLLALLESNFDVVAVLTRPDSRQGRKKILTASPVAQIARERLIPLIYANTIDEDVQQSIYSFGADLGVVVAYGALLPQQTLNSLRLGWINLHFSNLPLWRGAAPVQWQVMSGSQHAGSSVFQLVKELDAGGVYDCREWPISPNENSGELLSRLAHLGSQQVLEVVHSIDTGTAVQTPQTGVPTYARKLTIEDGHLDLSQGSEHVFNQYRGVTPEPGAYVFIGNERLKLIDVRPSIVTIAPAAQIISSEKKLLLGCSDGSLELITVQPFGKQVMSALDWFRGLRQEVVNVS